MKHLRIIRILSAAVILSLLLTIIPTVPVLALQDIILSSSSGTIGQTITVHGTNFGAGTTERYAAIYFSPNNVSIGGLFSSLTTYKFVGGSMITTTTENPADAGNFTATITIPSSLLEGSIDQNVTAGQYYIYVRVDTLGTTGTIINSKAAFTVTVPTLDTPSPASGPAGTSVMLTGSNFPASTALAVKFDTSTIPIDSGHTSTLSSGLFLSYITIPSTATVGAHTITVIVGTANASSTFTVTASPTLDTPTPSSGDAGISVTVTGTNFPASAALVFKFDTTTITPTSGDAATRSSGIFITVLTIPSSATPGAHSITATAGGLSASTTFTVTGTTPTPTPTLNALIPDSGPAGTNVAITGSGFAASTALVFTFDTTSLTPSGSTQTGTDGSFSSVIVIPSGAAAGAHTITVTAGTTSSNATFTVTGTSPTPPPTETLPLGVDMDGDFVGASVSIASSGFIPESTVTIAIDGENITQRIANESGFFIYTFELPPLQHGEHTITATDGTNTAAAIFTIESTAPNTPQPLSPAMGEAIASPATFDWDDATDTSAPVTYNLQIATTSTFAPDSIVINLTGLTESQYTLTEDEQLRLSSEITYYWREQAIDAAYNTSGWTGAGEFSMIKPFEFIGWPLYLTIGLGGLVLFLLGLWVGRRTAFFY